MGLYECTERSFVMGNVVQLSPHDNMTVRDCLEFCCRTCDELTDVIVVGYDKDGKLVIRTSNMTRKDALWILMHAADYTRIV